MNIRPQLPMSHGEQTEVCLPHAAFSISSAVPLGDGKSLGVSSSFGFILSSFLTCTECMKSNINVHEVLETSGESAESVKTNYSLLGFQLGSSTGGNERLGKDSHGGTSATKDP